MKKYIFRFLKTQFYAAFGTGTAFFLLFFCVLVFCKTAVYPPSSAFWVYILSFVWFAIDLLFVVHFVLFIRFQENRYHITFCDTGAKPLYPSSNIFLTDEWLIFAGRTAFYRPYIRNISIVSEKTNGGRNYQLKIHTDDDSTYYRSIDSNASAQKIRAWFYPPAPQDPAKETP